MARSDVGKSEPSAIPTTIAITIHCDSVMRRVRVVMETAVYGLTPGVGVGTPTGPVPRRSVECPYPYTKYNTRPIASHTPNRTQVSPGKPFMNQKQAPAPNTDTTQTYGT